MYGHTYSKGMDQPGKVANPARGQLNSENDISLSAFAPENLVSRDGFGSPVPSQCEWHRMTRMTGPDCAVMCNFELDESRRPFSAAAEKL